MDQRRLILLGTLLLVTLAASFYWYGESDSPLQPEVSEQLKELAPEAIVAQFHQTTFNELGVRQYHLEADTVTHYSEQSAAQMAKPVVTFYRKSTDEVTKNIDDSEYFDATDWVAKAKTGVIMDDGDTLILSGEVNVIKPVANQEAITFISESLMIRPKEEIAKTDEPVTIKQAQHITKAKGLNIDIAKGTVELLSRVRSQYVPATL